MQSRERTAAILEAIEPSMFLKARRGPLAAGLFVLLVAASPVAAAAPPAQPNDGPGGVGDRKLTIVKRAVGRTGASSFVFHAAGAAPAEGRPVAVFLHGWGATNPQSYGAWIDHLARNGWLVLFPRFQEVNRTRPADAVANAEGALKVALDALSADADAKPDPTKVALIGHLAGVPLAMDIAADAKDQGLPAPKLVFGVMPGGIASGPKSRGVLLGDLARIAPQTLLVTMIGDRDARAADLAARRLLREASAVPIERKLFMRALSDDHGFPALTATLAAPAGLDAAFDGTAIKLPADPKDTKPPPFKWSADMSLSGEQQTLVAQINNARADTLDYLAFRKTFDLAATAAFAGQDFTGLKTNPRFGDMERWADGWPVKRLFVETPRVSPPSAANASPVKPAARR